MKQPWLIQRCELGEGKLKYDYMGSSEFEVGDQSKSIKRIFAKGIRWGSATVKVVTSAVSEREVTVHMVAGEGFVFADYQPYLQQLANHELRLQEWTNFDDMVKAQAGIKTDRSFMPRTNVWFDFRNDVLWTLTEDNLKTLVSVLEGIKQKWSEKK